MSNIRPENHWKIVIAISLVAFASGTAVGVAGTLHYVWYNLPKFFEGPDKMPERIVLYLRHELNLSDEQAAKILTIFENSHRELKKIRVEAKPRIEKIGQATFEDVSQVLRPEQREGWRKWYETIKAKMEIHEPASSETPSK